MKIQINKIPDLVRKAFSDKAYLDMFDLTGNVNQLTLHCKGE